ncbi:MAG: DUF2304 domain-containing protein [Saprospiraceae bacterium]|nr:DUF2304 domain-containing protein [Saprospiraceae bacterium]
MGLKIKIVALIIGLIFFFFISRYSKKNAFKPSYTFLWFLVCLFLISIPIAESFYRWIAYSLIGIVDARHIIYIVLIGFLLVYVFYLTIKVSKLTDQVQQLISFTAILENQQKKGNNEE